MQADKVIRDHDSLVEPTIIINSGSGDLLQFDIIIARHRIGDYYLPKVIPQYICRDVKRL